MSAQAVAYVEKYSQAKGKGRAVILAMARACKKKKQPFVIAIEAEAICPDVGLKLRMVRYHLKDLTQNREIDPYVRGLGRSATCYEIICRSGAMVAPQAPKSWSKLLKVVVQFPLSNRASTPEPKVRDQFPPF